MRQLPRVAVGTIQPHAERQPMLWALLAALHAAGRELSHFHSVSCLAQHDAARSLTSSPSRHLDSWAMSRAGCLRALYRTSQHAELAVVEGDFIAGRPIVAGREAPGSLPNSRGSNLNTLCDWLDLPRIAIVDLAGLDACRLPSRPERLDGLLLDRAQDALHAAWWQTTLEAVFKVPVLGWLDRADSLRSLCRTLPAGRDPSPALCGALGRRLAASLRLDRLLALADRSPLPELLADRELAADPLGLDPFHVDDPSWELPEGPQRIAVAYDEDFCGYFPETLDLLEEAGAELCDFSPLHSEVVPEGADIVYIGCGHPERRPEMLAGNHCLLQSLRSFAQRGGRIYAEGSGLAYLCREIVLPGSSQAGDGAAARRFPMTGLLPAVAHWAPAPTSPEAVELTFRASSWMIETGTSIRGYRQIPWRIEPAGPLTHFAADPAADSAQALDMLGRGNVVGSQVPINLAANEHLLRRIVQPAVPVSVRARRAR